MGVSGDKLTHAVKAALPLARPTRPLRGSAAAAGVRPGANVLDVDLEAELTQRVRKIALQTMKG